MSICLLSAEEVGRLQHYKIEPCHKAHRHLSPRQAAAMYNKGSIQCVEINGEQYATPTQMYVLAPRKSGYIPVIQRVIGIPLKHIQPPTMLELEKEP